MDKPENYYAILGVPATADSDTLKRVYRQLARRYHPDLAGPEGALHMKRINRAYAALSDPDKRRQYDTLLHGTIDMRGNHIARPRPREHTFNPAEDIEFSGLNVFSSHGPLSAGPHIAGELGVITALSSSTTGHGLLVAAGSLNGKGAIWHIVDGQARVACRFAADPAMTTESLRALRFSSAGSLLAGWGRLHLHLWDTYSGERLWSNVLRPRAVSAYYSLDAVPEVAPDGRRLLHMALPMLQEDMPAPGSHGVRGSDVITHDLGAVQEAAPPLICTEENKEPRRFWAIRMRALSQDCRTLVTLSCAQLPGDQEQMLIVRRWDLTARSRLAGKPRPQVAASLALGLCSDGTPPYAVSPDASTIAYVSMRNKLLICDTTAGTFTEFASGTMGSSARLAISSDRQWLAVAREDSEINEGVIDLWSIPGGQILQKFYHPWQISALTFADQQLVVALTDGTIQIWH